MVTIEVKASVVVSVSPEVVVAISVYVRPVEILPLIEPAVKDVFKAAETSLVVLKLTFLGLAEEPAAV